MSNDAMREAFHAAARSGKIPGFEFYPAAFALDYLGEYESETLQAAWRVWEIAAPAQSEAKPAATATEIEIAVETLRHVIEQLRKTGNFNDEEGEATDFLEPIVDYFSTIIATPAPVKPAESGEARTVSLENLKETLLTPREIVRDEDGYLTHPGVPVLDEGVDTDKFVEAFGLESSLVMMEFDGPEDVCNHYFDAGNPGCNGWEPTRPQGDGWLLLEIGDSENGPWAWFIREKPLEYARPAPIGAGDALDFTRTTWEPNCLRRALEEIETLSVTDGRGILVSEAEAMMCVTNALRQLLDRSGCTVLPACATISDGMLTDAEIREVFLQTGFTIKVGQSDLKRYVYSAARALLAKRGGA